MSIIKYSIGFFVILLLASCNRVTVIIEEIPPNTPIGEDIYIVGNFNDWAPGNSNYQMRLQEDSTYVFSVPSGYGNLEFKFTRGNWRTVEKSLCGDEIENRSHYIDEDKTIVASIESWADLDPINCSERTICIELLPGNTPKDAEIAIASELNSWNPNIESIAQQTSKGLYCLNVVRPDGVNKIEFKVTRGDLSNAESDVFGNEVPNRVLEFGKRDTLKFSVEGWIDLPLNQAEKVTLLLESIPANTPKNEAIYFASRLNSWKSGDEKFRMKKNSLGQYYIQLKRKNSILDYKITRNGWHTVEVSQNGNDIDNRKISLRRSDTVYINVERWKDL